jgi:hypothetical protein
MRRHTAKTRRAFCQLSGRWYFSSSVGRNRFPLTVTRAGTRGRQLLPQLVERQRLHGVDGCVRQVGVFVERRWPAARILGLIRCVVL